MAEALTWLIDNDLAERNGELFGQAYRLTPSGERLFADRYPESTEQRKRPRRRYERPEAMTPRKTRDAHAA